MARPSVTLTREGALAIVTLSQPWRGNPVDAQLVAELYEVSFDLTLDTSVRVVLLRAEGSHFCRPSDARGRFVGLRELGPDAPDLVHQFDRALARLWLLPVPLLVSVQGHALGEGCSLVATADLVLAGESARFGAPTAGIMLPGESGTALRLAQRMGVARARRFCLLRESISAREAHACGLVDVLIPDEDLERTVIAEAHRLAAAPARDYVTVKAQFARILPGVLEAVMPEGRIDAEAPGGVRDVAEDARDGIKRPKSSSTRR
jgi:2-(1,2-epoxy-1,2-dihydrophenyl)acetyl-CoA isomerase